MKDKRVSLPGCCWATGVSPTTCDNSVFDQMNTKLLTKEHLSLINYEQKVEHLAVVM